ncbi:hypothetical protein MRX96_009504 [Rhipicephalus microplus]
MKSQSRVEYCRSDNLEPKATRGPAVVQAPTEAKKKTAGSATYNGAEWSHNHDWSASLRVSSELQWRRRTRHGSQRGHVSLAIAAGAGHTTALYVATALELAFVLLSFGAALQRQAPVPLDSSPNATELDSLLLSRRPTHVVSGPDTSYNRKLLEAVVALYSASDATENQTEPSTTLNASLVSDVAKDCAEIAVSQRASVHLMCTALETPKVGKSHAHGSSLTYTIYSPYDKDDFGATRPPSTAEDAKTTPTRDPEVEEEKQQATSLCENKDFTAHTLVARNLCKSLDESSAVRDFNLALRPSECFGLLGVHGSGKTTTLNLLAGLTEATYSEAYTEKASMQENARKWQSQISYYQQTGGLLEKLNAYEFLQLVAGLRGVSPNDLDIVVNCVISIIDIKDNASKPCGVYRRPQDSGTAKRRTSVTFWARFLALHSIYQPLASWQAGLLEVGCLARPSSNLEGDGCVVSVENLCVWLVGRDDDQLATTNEVSGN